MIRLSHIAILALLISGFALSVGFANAAEAPQVSSKAEAARLQGAADRVLGKIQQSKTETEALVGAVRSNNKALAKEILARNGFSRTDLERARIVLKDETRVHGSPDSGDKVQRVKVTIGGRCCPPQIVITIYF